MSDEDQRVESEAADPGEPGGRGRAHATLSGEHAQKLRALMALAGIDCERRYLEHLIAKEAACADHQVLPNLLARLDAARTALIPVTVTHEESRTTEKDLYGRLIASGATVLVTSRGQPMLSVVSYSNLLEVRGTLERVTHYCRFRRGARP
jgi:hypothetical protein